MIWELFICLNMNWLSICQTSVIGYYPDEAACIRAMDRFTPSDRQRVDFKLCGLRNTPTLFYEYGARKP